MNISACMIVKNEEDSLERCLNSIKDIVDEIVIVDTGSTDSTVEVAKHYTDKIYFHEWENNFALHRNQSISYATGDWILIIDADETLETNLNKTELKELLNKVPENINSCAVVMEDIQKDKVVMRCNSARFFRNGKVEYKGRVHNQPIIEGSSAVLQDIVLNHYGYDLSYDKMIAKFERTKNLLMEQYEKHENPHVEFYLCQLYGQHKKLKESQEWGEKYYCKREQLGEHFNQTTYFTLTKSYMDSNNSQRAWEIINDFLSLKKPDPDMSLAISDFGAKENRLDIMGMGCRKYLKDYEFFEKNQSRMGGKFFFSMRDDVKRLILYRLCMVCFHEGMVAFKLIKDDLHLLDSGTQNDLKGNFERLGLSFLLEDNNYNLPKLQAV